MGIYVVDMHLQVRAGMLQQPVGESSDPSRGGWLLAALLAKGTVRIPCIPFHYEQWRVFVLDF